MDWVGQLSIPMRYGPKYIWDLQLAPAWDREYVVPIPMYEGYFDTPFIVQDSFVICKKSINGKPPTDPGDWHTEYNLTVTLARYNATETEDGDPIHYPMNGITNSTCIEIGVLEYDDTTIYDTIVHWNGWRRTHFPNFEGYVFLFPILTPEPVGIDEANPVERNTIISPNPATETVKVASGFGLQEIEVFDAAGARVHTQKASGFSTTLNVGSWPRGTYLLRIRTAMGMATKKLVVQ